MVFADLCIVAEWCFGSILVAVFVNSRVFGV